MDEEKQTNGMPIDVWDKYLAPRVIPKIGSNATLINELTRELIPVNVLDQYSIGKFKTKQGAEFEIAIPVFDMNLLTYFASLVQFRKSKGFDSVILITGQERAGKSTLAQILSRLIMPDLPLDNICFKIDDFNKAITSGKPGDCIIMDEAGYDLFNQEWWSEFQIELNKKLMVIAKQRLVLILVLPHRMDLNGKIRNRRVTFWLDVKTRGRELKRGFCVLREGIHSEWVQDPFWNALAACTFNGLHDDYWKEYEIKKDAFIDEVNHGTYNPKGSRSRDNKERDLEIYNLIEEGVPQVKIAKAKNMSISNVSTIYSKMKEKLSEPH